MSPPAAELRRGEPLGLELREATRGGPPRRRTRVTLVDRGDALVARFDCVDPEPWATLVERDAPLWREEVVELFVAPGAETPTRYFEIEVNPLGAVFDAVVDSPHGDRRDLRVDTAWTCAGLRTSAAIDRAAGVWSAEMVVPWSSIGGADGTVEAWRLNLLRVDRPRDSGDGVAEFSAWSPTFVEPADFHRPKDFASLRRILR